MILPLMQVFPHFMPNWILILIPQSKQQARALSLSIPSLPTGQIRDVRIARKRCRDVATRLDSSDLDQPIPCLRHGLADDVCGLGFTLCADDVGLSLLLCLLDDEARALGVLLRDLLLFDGAGEFAAEGHVRDGDVFERDVEFLRAAEEVRSDAV